MSVLLRAEGLRKSFDELISLDSVDLELRAGEVHAIIGENGAGKTTLSNVLAGLYRPDAGHVEVNGVPVRITSPRGAAEVGIGMVHQHFKLVPSMSVAANLLLGAPQCPGVFSPHRLRAIAARILDTYGSGIDPATPVWQLSIGEQQRIEIFRVLARGARVLILDEPTAVLAGSEVDRLFELLRELAADACAVVFISHKLREVFSVADQITVMRHGRIVGTGPTLDFDPATVGELMTGGADSDSRDFVRKDISSSAPVLVLRGVSVASTRGSESLRDVDLAVCPGEIVGVAGVSGNGQSELALVATGLCVPTPGSVEVAGADMTGEPPARFQSAGVGHIAEDRMNVSLVRSASVHDNAVLRHYREADLSSRWWLHRRELSAFAERVTTGGRVQFRSVHAPIAQLSGGNQQRLVACREAFVAQVALVAVHPTRGLDVGASAEVQRAIQHRAADGCGVLYVSDDLDELFSISNRIVVMYDGRIVGDFDRDELDRAAVGRLMGGHLEEEGLSS